MTPSSEFDEGEFVRALLDPDLPPPAGLEAGHGLPTTRRFAVYRNNVVAGLIDALAERFPVCVRLVGQDFFRAMAHSYVRVSLPRVPMLFEYGEDFGEFVSSFEPARSLPYLPDVARLEYAVGRAYHAGDAMPLFRDVFRSLPPEGLESATVSLHPSTQVLASAYPVVSIWRENTAPEPPQIVTLDHAEDGLVVRPHLDVEVCALPVGGSTFVEALMGGRAFGEAAKAATRRTKDFDLTACLRALLACEAFTAISVEECVGSSASRQMERPLEIRT